MFIALGLSMDAFAVAVTEGLRKGRDIHAAFALSVAACFGIFQAAMAFFGYIAGSLFAELVAGFSNWLAFGLLVFIGGRMVFGSIRGRKNEGGESEISKNAPLGFWTLIFLGIATSIDSLAVGVNFALDGGVNIAFAAGIIGITTFLVSLAGVCFGKLLGRFLAKYAELAGGIILIGIGIHILISG